MSTVVTTFEVPALVVGAGPVGLALACELRRHGVPCRIIDKEPEPSAQSKALGVQSRTLEVFENIGIIEPALARGRKVHGVNMYANQRRIVHLTLDELDAPHPYALILPQSDTERLLIEQLARLGGQVERRSELTSFRQEDGGVSATVRTAAGAEQTVRSRWLLGCDGARSTVRTVLKLSFEGATYEEHFALADLQMEWTHPDDEIYAFFAEDGPLAVFPLPGAHRYRLVTALPPGSEAPEGAEANLKFWSERLEARGVRGVRLSNPEWLSSFRVHRRQVPQYRAGNCFVMGDAAHIHSPMGGQGMNTGIQDAYNLAWKMGLVHAGAARDTLLDSFQVERQPIAAAVLRDTDLATRAITLRHPLAQRTRNMVLSFVSNLEVVQQRIGRTMSEMTVNYRTSPIIAEDRASLLHSLVRGRLGNVGETLDFGAAPAAGDRAPDVILSASAEGAFKRLFDFLRGTKHTLLLFTGAAPTDGCRHLETIAERVRDRYGRWITVYLVVPNAAPPAELHGKEGVLLDADGILHRRYGAGAECLYLIRPDGYVGYRAQPADADKLFTYLGKLFV